VQKVGKEAAIHRGS